MDTDRWLRIKEIFHAALQHEPHGRDAFLDESCQGNPELRQEVAALLRSHGEADKFLEQSGDTGLLGPAPGEALCATRIGQYLVERVISTGGMGTVYEAIQENPRRTVAIKVMREGLASKSLIRRFAYESQILARLTHPHIAQVIEAGTHEEKGGLPYFVMEYIQDARTLTEYAWEKVPDLKEQLSLFLQACDAVHHGHQKGVIHRDLKPTNILVDGTGQVKIIDFGIARATDSDLRLTTLQTDVGRLMGTVQYMSPEQCKADPGDLDIRSDVYALGVVLYELLCGNLPYNVRDAAIFEATRIIREAPPRRPSTTNRSLRGDVETIVLKSLEKERTRRYQTVADFSTDIRRFLKGEVIMARPAGPVTRTWKSMKRKPVLSTVLLAAALFIGYILFISYPQIRHERDRFEKEKVRAQQAEQKALDALQEAALQREAALGAQAAAEEESRHSKAINDFLKSMLASPSPGLEGREVKVVDVLDRAAKKTGGAFPDRPLIEATLRNIMGDTYTSLGKYDRAEEQHRAAIAIRRRVEGDENPLTLQARAQLGMVLRRQTRWAESEALLREVAATCIEVLGKEHPITLETQCNLAATLGTMGHLKEGETILREVVAIQGRILGKEKGSTLSTKTHLAAILNKLGKQSESIALYREVLDAHRRLRGDEDPATLSCQESLAYALAQLGFYDEAADLLRQAFEGQKRILGEDHPFTLHTMFSLAATLARRYDLAEAESLFRSGMEICDTTYGENHIISTQFMGGLADLLSGTGRVAEAESIFRSVVRIQSDHYGPNHLTTRYNRTRLAIALSRQDKLQEAMPIFQACLQVQRSTRGDDHPDTLDLMHNVAAAHFVMEQLEEARSIYEEILAIEARTSTMSNAKSLKTRNNLGSVLFFMGALHESERMHREVLASCRIRLRAEHPYTLEALYCLSQPLRALGRFDEAERLCREALEKYNKVLDEKHPDALHTMDCLAQVLHRQGRLEEAEALARKALESRWQVLGEEHSFTVRSMITLSVILMDQGRLSESESLFDEALNITERLFSDREGLVALLSSSHGRLLLLQERWEEAEASLLAGYEGYKSWVGTGHYGTQGMVDLLIRLYEVWGKEEEAAVWRARHEEAGREGD